MKKEQLVRSSIVVTSIRILGAFAALFLTLIASRLMGKTETGEFFLYLSLVAIASTIGRMGLDQVLLRNSSTNADLGCSDYLYFICRSALSSIIISFLILLLYLPVMNTNVEFNLGVKFLIFGISLLSASTGSALTVLSSYILRGRGYLGTSVFYQSVSIPLIALCVLAISIYLMNKDISVELTIIAYSASAAACALGALWLVFKNCNSSNQPNLEARKMLKNEAHPLIFVSIMQVTNQWLPVLLLPMLNSLEATADYHVALRLTLVAHLLLFGITTVVSRPLALAFQASSLLDARKLFLFSLLASALAGGLYLGILFLFAGHALEFFGPNYQDTLTLKVLCIGQFVNVCVGPTMTVLAMMGKTYIVRRCSLCGGLTTLVLLPSLVPLYGAPGAATAVTTGIVITNLMALLYVNKSLGYPFRA